MDTTEDSRQRTGSRKDTRVWVARAGVMVALAGVLTACGGQPAAQPTTAPAATTIPATDATAAADETTTEPAAEATASADVAASPAAVGMASPVAGLASPVAGMATPVGDMATPIAAGMATPLADMASPAAGMASPVAGGEATPVGEAIAYTPEICEQVNDWLAKPEVAPLLEQPIWNQILEEGQKAAAGEPVDVEQMKADFATLDGAATTMRDVASSDVRHGPVAIVTQMIGRSARLAGGLADGTETQEQAQAAVTELQGLISAYEADTAAREAACGA
jgi:hypothetical protein